MLPIINEPKSLKYTEELAVPHLDILLTEYVMHAEDLVMVILRLLVSSHMCISFSF